MNPDPEPNHEPDDDPSFGDTPYDEQDYCPPPLPPENDRSQTGKHQGEWRRCQKCGAPENDHPYRHPFKEWQSGRGRVIPPEVPRDRAPANYAEQRALLDDSLRDIPPGGESRG